MPLIVSRRTSCALTDAAFAAATPMNPGIDKVRDIKIQKEYNAKRKKAGEAAFELQKKQQANIAAAKEAQAAKKAAEQAVYAEKRAAWEAKAAANEMKMSVNPANAM